MTKQNEKEIIIDGVHYKMSPADYKLASNHLKQLQEILARARVVKDDNSPVSPAKNDAPAKSVAKLTKPVAKPKKTPVVKEQLTDDVLRRLFGANNDYVCIFNNETRMIRMSNIYDRSVDWTENDTAYSKNLKRVFEWAFPKFELVAQVTMQVSGENYPGYSKWSNREVKFNRNGEYIVGNLIIRNKESGKLKLFVTGSWFGVNEGLFSPKEIASICAYCLTYKAAKDMKFLADMIGNGRN